MKVTIKVEGVFDNGEGYGTRTHTMEVPQFKKQIVDLKKISHNLNNLPENMPTHTVSIESQIMEWLDNNVNFLQIFDDMYLCINYDIEKIHNECNKLAKTKTQEKPKQHIDKELMLQTNTDDAKSAKDFFSRTSFRETLRRLSTS